jgi:hypothetical protein
VRRRVALCSLIGIASLIAGRFARAQDPVPLPAIVSRAAPGPKAMVGVVRDTLGFTVGGAEVVIASLKRRTLSRDDGVFRFDSLPKGTFEVRARKIGYAPQVRVIIVDSVGGTGDFELIPIARPLPAIVSTVARGGLRGVVGDTAFRRLPGVVVHVAGVGLIAETDSGGAFFLPVKPGRYAVTFTKDGFRSRVASVDIPSDSGRHITEMLQPFSGRLPKNEVWNIADLNSRISWLSNPAKNAFYSREQLEKMGVEWAYDAVQMTAPKLGLKEAVNERCAVVVDGGPGTAALNTLTTDQIESIEVYGGTAGSQATPRYGKIQTPPHAKVSNTGRASSLNFGMVCPTVYVWTR